MILEISKKVFENILWEFLRKPQALSKTGASYLRHMLKSKNMFREAMYYKTKQKLSKHYHNKAGGGQRRKFIAKTQQVKAVLR